MIRRTTAIGLHTRLDLVVRRLERILRALLAFSRNRLVKSTGAQMARSWATCLAPTVVVAGA